MSFVKKRDKRVLAYRVAAQEKRAKEQGEKEEQKKQKVLICAESHPRSPHPLTPRHANLQKMEQVAKRKEQLASEEVQEMMEHYATKLDNLEQNFTDLYGIRFPSIPILSQICHFHAHSSQCP